MNAPGNHDYRTQLCQQRRVTQDRGLQYHHHEIHTLFEELIHKPWGTACWTPPVDVWENEDTFTIEMDLPGMKGDQIEIRVQGRTLTLEGQRERILHTLQTSSRLHERCDGRFSRSFQFDFILEDETIENRWQDGVLTLIVPKPKRE
jgi:HSP20 family molecular chaperone IbpA